MTNTLSVQWEANECPRTVRPVGGVADPPTEEAIDMGDPTYPEDFGAPAVYDVPVEEWTSVPRFLGGMIDGFVDSLADRSKRADELRRMPYHEYLQTEEWANLRRIAQRKAQYRCQRCRQTSRMLNVHHLTYDRRGQEELRDLVLLCRNCHRAEHGIGAQTHDHTEDA